MENRVLAKEIRKRVSRDQNLRRQYLSGRGYWDDRVDAGNTDWLKGIVKQFGWPTISLVGKTASRGSWLLAQHADHDLQFQKRVLQLLVRHAGDIDPENIKYLTDRILFSEGKPQIFGTQYKKT